MVAVFNAGQSLIIVPIVSVLIDLPIRKNDVRRGVASDAQLVVSIV